MGLSVHPEAKGLIFDLDGTLSDSLPVHLANWNKIGEKFGFVFDPQIMAELTGRATIDFARRIVDEYNLTVDPEEIVRLKQTSFWDSPELLVPVDEIISIVREYHGKLPMAVGTGASRRSAEVQLKQLGLTNWFDAVVTSNDVIRHKPYPDTFLECARIMGVEPALCQVFEDGDLGIEAAKSAGMFVTDVRKHINYGNWLNS